MLTGAGFTQFEGVGRHSESRPLNETVVPKDDTHAIQIFTIVAIVRTRLKQRWSLPNPLSLSTASHSYRLS